MIINIRYYVIMSASIFLALGVGIFIGFTLDGQEIFVEQQQGLISELEQRFLELKRENDLIESVIEDREKELQTHRELAEIILPRLVEGSLAGLNIAIIQSSDGFACSGMINMLSHAGAQITSITCLKGAAFDDEPQKAALLQENLDEFVESGDLYPYVTGRLVNAITTGGDLSFIERMKGLGVIDVSGEYNGEVDYFILAWGGSGEGPGPGAETVLPVMDAIKRCNIPVVGVEETGCEGSYVLHYKDAGISSVDNIDNIIGQYSLIMVLQGMVGHYGVKETADAVVPDPPDKW